MKKLIAAVAVVSVAPLVNHMFAAENTAAPKTAATEQAETAAETEEESPAIFEAGFDYDFLSAYVWRNAVQNDEMVMQPCVWADLTYFEPFWFGFSIWQNYDITDRRHEIYSYGLNETDYNVHIGATAWSSEDEDYSLDLEIGHEWYTYHGVRDGLRNDYPNTRELYAKANFDNPFVGVYGQASWMYKDFGCYRQALHYELGFTKEIELTDALTLGADWNLNFGDPRYLAFLYGGTSSGAYYDEEEEAWYEDYTSNPDGGIGGTTIKIYLTWQITEWLSLGGVIGYTGVLNGSARDSIGELAGDYEFCNNPNTDYPRDLLWGGLQLRLTY